MGDEGVIRRSFLFLGIALTLFGCFIAALGIALPAWQIVELTEFNSVHEHGIFYDCIRSETYPLESLRQANTARQDQLKEDEDQISSSTYKQHLTPEDSSSGEHKREEPVVIPASPFSAKKCIYKMDSASSSTWTMRMAIEEGDPAAREMLFHRFMPQHKAVIFFFIFSVIFSLISILVGSCSACFVPNGILHVISVSMAMCCSILGDVIFFLASVKVDNSSIHGLVYVYNQNLSYAYGVHVFGSATLCAATICSSIAAYLLVRREFQQYGCCNSKPGRPKFIKQCHYLPYLSNVSNTNDYSQSNPHISGLNKPSGVEEATDVYDCCLYSCSFPSMSFYGNKTVVEHLPLREAGKVGNARFLSLQHHQKKLNQHERPQLIEHLPPPPPVISQLSNNSQRCTAGMLAQKPTNFAPQPVPIRVSSPCTTSAVFAAEYSPNCSGNATKKYSAASAMSAPPTYDNKDTADHILMVTF